MTDKQYSALARLSERYDSPFEPKTFRPAFDLPDGWVEGWVGPIFVGCSPEGEIHS